jgi:pimeloyl-ACP methyl ester carboxylesterase
VLSLISPDLMQRSLFLASIPGRATQFLKQTISRHLFVGNNTRRKKHGVFEMATKKQRLSVYAECSCSDSFEVPGLLVKDRTISVPLDHSRRESGDIVLFFREIVQRSKIEDQSLPFLLFLQGGPGFEAPRPTDASSWIKAATNHFRVILMDQRGTGRSSRITCANLASRGSPEVQAAYLHYFRADSIVKDAEMLRQAIVPASSSHGRWAILGQSFGGFCVVTYLSLAPQGLSEALITGGLPPGILMKCSADDVYRALTQRIILQNDKYYKRFPQDEGLIRKIVLHIANKGGVSTPAGNIITSRSFQALGLSALGFSHGFERLHYLLENPFDGDELSFKFKKDFDSWFSFDTNPLYAILHEAIYCQGGSSQWAAQRAIEVHLKFNAENAAVNGQRVYFTGEMIFPSMFDDFAELRKIKDAAQIVSNYAHWPELYNVQQLKQNTVPVAAASYYEDMFVDFNLAQETFSMINGGVQHITNEYLHDGIREGGSILFDRLLNLVRGGTLIR